MRPVGPDRHVIPGIGRRGGWALLALLGLVAGIAVGAPADPRGWRASGPVAEGAAQVLAAAEPVVLDLPASFAELIQQPTLVVFFSPTCPHCQHVAPELAALAGRLDGASVIGVATGGSTPDDIRAFRETYGWTFEVVHDTRRDIGAALGARGTPAAFLVSREGDELVARDTWLPYAPGTDVLVEMRLAGDPWVRMAPDRYVGNRTCGACHTRELEGWLLTHHSVAWRTLGKIGKQADPACVGCHVTGKGQPGGWSGDPASALVDVGCESCHGASGPHDGHPTEPATTCAGCHDAEHSIAFSYEKGLPLIDHFRSVGAPGHELRALREALLDGEAPRELLAFGGGGRVGSAACATCHEAEHAGWKASPHGQAMASLPAAAAADVGCVKCHATQKTSGPPPAELAGFRVDEGVGCESCHGPGQAHVEAGGGKDNIVGLGESCPVCIVEAVCTSCHTKAWDPTWQLEPRLEAVRHAR